MQAAPQAVHELVERNVALPNAALGVRKANYAVQ